MAVSFPGNYSFLKGPLYEQTIEVHYNMTTVLMFEVHPAKFSGMEDRNSLTSP